MSYNIGDTNERSTPTEPFELEEEQRQQVDTVYDIDIHGPISIDVVTGQPLGVGDHLSRSSTRERRIDKYLSS
ncbi:hypothetical protein [Exiguobacterium sp. N4-1P]|uniref:hypothetical protein n=1 Tax=Exiguobacterium sp. N4-1P TaxID=2051906 RepID=UPI0012FF7079|nr:hypothetical protein [Exiguobacterium sp. N4-1P]